MLRDHITRGVESILLGIDAYNDACKNHASNLRGFRVMSDEMGYSANSDFHRQIPAQEFCRILRGGRPFLRAGKLYHQARDRQYESHYSNVDCEK